MVSINKAKLCLYWLLLTTILVVVVAGISDLFTGSNFNEPRIARSSSDFQSVKLSIDLITVIVIMACVVYFGLSILNNTCDHIELKSNKLTGPSNFGMTQKQEIINLTKPFNIKRAVITFPFKTILVRQGNQQVCLSTTFMNLTKFQSLLDQIRVFEFPNSRIN